MAQNYLWEHQEVPKENVFPKATFMLFQDNPPLPPKGFWRVTPNVTLGQLYVAPMNLP
jgi:hypothetical protein